MLKFSTFQAMVLQMRKEVIIESSAKSLMDDARKDYLVYILVERGDCRFAFHQQSYEASQGDLITLRRLGLLTSFHASDSFVAKIVYVQTPFIDRCAAIDHHKVRGFLNIWLNPVIRLSKEQINICKDDFRQIELRLSQKNHNFYEEQLLTAVQSALLDILDFETHDGIIPESPGQASSLMSRFIEMLNDGAFLEHREVTYYSTRLCVSSKYLSEISKRTTGYPANYWINRYTAQAILKKLRDKSLSILQIAELFNFSSPSYFSRYVQKNLGKNPSELRD